MDSLFLYRDAGNRRKQFIKANSDAIASQINAQDGIILSSIALSEREYPLEAEDEASLFDRGLVERKKDGTLKITETGLKAVSYYPMLGRKAERRHASASFFPMLLSLIASGELSDHHALYSRYLSSDLITARFTRISKEDFAWSAVRTIESLDELGMLRHDGGKLSIDKDTALSFFDLPRHDKLAYMLHPELDGEQHRRLSHALMILGKLSAFPEEELSALLERLSSITGSDLTDDTEALFRFSFLYEEDGLVSAFEEDEGTGEAIISSDFTITADGSLKEPVFLFSEPLKADISEQWVITRTSARAAFSMGLTDRDILKELRKISRESIPDTIAGRLASWYGSFSSLRCMRALIITADDKNARVMDALPTLKVHIITKAAPNVFVMNPSTEEEWRKILRTAGFDMLGRTEGLELRERNIAKALIPSSFSTIPDERRIPFNQNLQDAMAEKAESTLMKALVRSGFVLSEDTPQPAVSMILGLYYQEKARLISELTGRNARLYAEFADGSVIIGNASKAEEPGHVIIDGRDIDIAKIWKAAELPLSVRPITEEGKYSSDSDNL